MAKKPYLNLLRFLSLIILMIGFLPQKSHAEDMLRLHTTTSIHNSGLLDYLFPIIETQENFKIRAVIHGTGQAIQAAIAGDSDVIITHAPALEQKFVSSGYGIKRHPFMSNSFVILGVVSDPAHIAGMESGSAAFAKIAAGKFIFISRGDKSGTHLKELSLWQEADIDIETIAQSGKWYLETGSGMGNSLNIAFERRGYILSDYGTWLNYRNKNRDHRVLLKDIPEFHNQYAVIAVNPQKHPHVRHDLAERLIAFLTSTQGKQLINDYKINGSQVFFSD